MNQVLDKLRRDLDYGSNSRKKLRHEFSITRALLNRYEGKSLNESDESVMRRIGDDLNKQGLTDSPDSGIFVPHDRLARALGTGIGSSGGYLAGVDVVPGIVDLNQSQNLVLATGVTVIGGLQNNQVLPRTASDSPAVWQGSQGSSVSSTDAALGQLSITPHTCIALFDFSVQLLRVIDAESIFATMLARKVWSALFQAILNGAGGAQPVGILNTAGVQTQSGTTLAQAGVLNMKRLVAEANAVDGQIGFVSTPAVRALLEARERGTNGDSMIWENDRVASRPAFATIDCPTATMVCGNFADVVLGIWGPGIELQISQGGTGRFNQGLLSIRAMIMADVAVLRPSAFVVASSIT